MNIGQDPICETDTFGFYPFGKWEIIIWERIHLGKYPTAIGCRRSKVILLCGK